MKVLILASIFCLALPAQEQIPVVPQIIPLPSNIGVWHAMQGVHVVQGIPARRILVPRELKGKVQNLMKFDAPGGVCSVPLLEAHANANDPGIATTLRDNSVPIPQARVPAPPCKKE